ncbi:MAG: hypothetical protein K1X88_18715 [Nannocystaceae bacterium]|nr:hypothetical protein [Nannocystaceae bacterium]
MNAKTLTIALVLAALGACTGKKDTTKPDGKGGVCTEEAKVCPDGSSVSRSGPNCEFAACPEAKDGEPVPDQTDDADKDGGGEAEPADDAQ